MISGSASCALLGSDLCITYPVSNLLQRICDSVIVGWEAGQSLKQPGRDRICQEGGAGAVAPRAKDNCCWMLTIHHLLLPSFEMPSKTPVLPSVPRSPSASTVAVRASMVGNRSTDTKPEIALRRALTYAGLADFTVHPKLPGTPDIAFEAQKVVVFVHGCFWHRCPHCSLRLPASNAEYWAAKFARTQARDKLNSQSLKSHGWRVIVVWECKLYKSPRQQVRRIRRWLARQ